LELDVKKYNEVTVKLTQKLTILFESKVPSGTFKFVKANGKTGDQIEASKELRGSKGDFKKAPHNGLDFLSDGPDNIFIGNAVVKQTGNKLAITDNYGSTYHFEKV
jgi:hypothetical protein